MLDAISIYDIGLFILATILVFSIGSVVVAHVVKERKEAKITKRYAAMAAHPAGKGR